MKPFVIIHANRLGCLAYLLLFVGLNILFVGVHRIESLPWPDRVPSLIFGALAFAFLWCVGLNMVRDVWRRKIELNEQAATYRDEWRTETVPIANLQEITVSRGAGFHGSWTLLMLATRAGGAEKRWDVTSFTLRATLQVAAELSRRANLPHVTIVQERCDEKSLRSAARGVGTLSLLLENETPLKWKGEAKEQIFLFEPQD